MVLPCLNLDNRPAHNTITLRGYTYWYSIAYFGVHLSMRLILCCPALPSQITVGLGARYGKLSEAIKFGSLLAGIQDVAPYFMENSTILASILRQSSREGIGSVAPWTAATLDEDMLAWLARKGLNEADILELEAVVGSMTRGILMLLHALPRRPGASRARSAKRYLGRDPSTSDHQHNQGFDPNIFSKVKTLYQGIWQRQEDKWITHAGVAKAGGGVGQAEDARNQIQQSNRSKPTARMTPLNGSPLTTVLPEEPAHFEAAFAGEAGDFDETGDHCQGSDNTSETSTESELELELELELESESESESESEFKPTASDESHFLSLSPEEMARIEQQAAGAPSRASSEPDLERDLETALCDALFRRGRRECV